MAGRSWLEACSALRWGSEEGAFKGIYTRLVCSLFYRKYGVRGIVDKDGARNIAYKGSYNLRGLVSVWRS